MDFPNGSYYIGDLLQLSADSIVKDGCGVFVDKVKNKTYEGEYLHDQKHGQGTTTYATKMHQGEYLKNLRHGYGKMEFITSGYVYEGEFRHGQFHGEGRLFNSITGEEFDEGTFRKGVLIRGTRQHRNGKRYCGALENDMEHGYGITTFSNGNKHEGFYSRGKMHGRGEWYDCAENLWWRGEFSCGKRDCTKPFLIEHMTCTFVLLGREASYSGRMDGDEDSELAEEFKIKCRMGEFDLVNRELQSGTYTTGATRVSAQEFERGPCVRDGTFGSWHDASQGNVRFAKLGPEGSGPIGKALFAYANRDGMEARVEVYKNEGVVAEVIHF